MKVKLVSYANVTSTLALVVALSGGAYAAGLIGTSQLKNGAVTTAKLHGAAVSTAKLKDGAVTGTKLASNAVSGTKLAAASVDGSKLSPSLVASLSGAVDAVKPLTSHTQDFTIQTVGTQVKNVATITYPAPGSYLIVGTLRTFNQAGSTSAVGLYCNLDNVSGPQIINTQVSGVEDLPFVGFIDQAVTPSTLQCHTFSGSVTMTYDLSVLRVNFPS